jgi:hypothetical protein
MATFYTCAKCGEPVHQHHFWLAGGRKYHFNCLPAKRKAELAQEGITQDNGAFLLGALEVVEYNHRHGESVANTRS